MRTPAITIFVVCILIFWLAVAFYNYWKNGLRYRRPEEMSKYDAESINEAMAAGKEAKESDGEVTRADAMQAYIRQQYEKAIEEYEGALIKFPNNSYLHNDLGTMYYNLGLQSMNPPIREGEFGTERRIDVTVLDDSQAILEIRNAVENKKSGIVVAIMGTNNAKSEIVKYAQSAGHYVYSEAMESEYGLVDFWVTVITGKTKEMFLKAEEEYLKAIEIMSDYSPAYRNLGTLYSRMGRSRDAVNQWRLALGFEPADEELERLINSYE